MTSDDKMLSLGEMMLKMMIKLYGDKVMQEDVKIETKIRLSLTINEISDLLSDSNVCKALDIDGQQVDLVIQMFDYARVDKKGELVE